MRLPLLITLIGVSVLTTVSMQLAGGTFTMTVLLAGTSSIAPLWLLPIELLLGFAMLRRQGWATGIAIAGTLILGEELYLAAATRTATPLSLDFQAAHTAIFAAIAVVAMASFKELNS